MKHVSIYECPLAKIMYIRPVIFIPGIMGTKLKNAETGDRAWEPDDKKSWAAGHAVKGAAGKRSVLIGPPTRHEFDPNFLEVLLDEDEEDAVERLDAWRQKYHAIWTTADDERIKKWLGLSQGFYGEFLQGLEHWEPLKAENRWHYKRVYAHPYNWSASNQTSAEKLAETVDFAIRNTQEWINILSTGVTLNGIIVPILKPLKPIIVTHSMGGLVSRGYTQSNNRANADKIAGVLHIAMPTDGSPNAYANMLAGSDSTKTTYKWVFGANQKEMTATGGNMPGALELLPNHIYKDGQGQKATRTKTSSGWLQICRKDGTIEYSWPNSIPPVGPDLIDSQNEKIQEGDPYEQIYLNQYNWWRLIYKEFLNPYGDDDDAAFAACRRSILNAKAFHVQVNKYGKFHPNTRMLYSDSAAAEFQACDVVRWNLTITKLPIPENARVESNGKGMIEYNTYHMAPALAANPGRRMYPISHTTYEMERLKAPGDATVHRGAAAYEKGPLIMASKNGFNHTDAFTNNEVRNWVREQLKIMAEEDIACMPIS